MDTPVTPEEHLRDAICALTLAMEKILEMLQVLACEVIVSGGSLPFHPDEDGPIRP